MAGFVVWNLPFAELPANYSAPVLPLRRLQRGMVRQPQRCVPECRRSQWVKLALDGDSIRYNSKGTGQNRVSGAQTVAGSWGMSEREIAANWSKGDSLAFEKKRRSTVYKLPRPKRVIRLRGKCCPVFNWKVRRSRVS